MTAKLKGILKLRPDGSTSLGLIDPPHLPPGRYEVEVEFQVEQNTEEEREEKLMAEVSKLDLARIIDGLKDQGMTPDDIRDMVEEIIEEGEED